MKTCLKGAVISDERGFGLMEPFTSGIRFSLLALAAVLALTPVLPGWATDADKVPAIALTKASAEAGDAKAQWKLGQTYLGIFDYSTGEKWLRLAAMQGLAAAQTDLGAVLLTGKPSSRNGQAGVKADVEQAINWFQRAAEQGEPGAMFHLGDFLQRQSGFPQKRVEAYKWFKLAADRNHSTAKVYLDRLILVLSLEEVAQGQALVVSFVPQPGKPVPRPYPTVEPLVLKGISGIASNRMAILNNRTFLAGETRMVSLGAVDAKVRCMAIGTTSVWVEVEGFSGIQEVGFKQR